MSGYVIVGVALMAVLFLGEVSSAMSESVAGITAVVEPETGP